MCNLYSTLIAPGALRAFYADISLDFTEESLSRNYEPEYVGADQDGPVIRWEENDRQIEISTLRWGFPPAPIKNAKRKPAPITNIRNLDSRWWKHVNGDYLNNAIYRCLVPFEKFAEWSAVDKANAWFEVDADVSVFAGIWRPWTGERLLKVDGQKRRVRTETEWELYAFLTTDPNNTVKAVHPKAMPVILTTPDECKAWMEGVPAKELQRPLPDSMTTRLANE